MGLLKQAAGRLAWLPSVCDLPKKAWEGRVCRYMHARTIHNVLAQGRTVQKVEKGGSNHPNPPGKSHPGCHTAIQSHSVTNCNHPLIRWLVIRLYTCLTL